MPGVCNSAATDKGMTLIKAAGIGNLSNVQKALSDGADINEKNNNDMTALMAAAKNGHIYVVKLLMEKKADVNAVSSPDGKTALFYALERGRIKIAELLLKTGASVNLTATVPAWDVQSDSERSSVMVFRPGDKDYPDRITFDKSGNSNLEDIALKRAKARKNKKLNLTPLEFAKKNMVIELAPQL
jgi:ankyrin repeat protein